MNNGRHGDDVGTREAIAAAERHWKVFPAYSVRNGHCECPKGSNCNDAGKHPRLKGWAQLATDDVSRVKRWAQLYPGTNWGVACGPSRLVGIDADPRHGGDVTMAALEKENGRLPHTPRAITGDLGDHRYFLEPGNGCYIGNWQNAAGPGVDTRGGNGFLVLAGSLHKSGRRYAWDPNAHPDEIPLASLPSWLIDRVTENQRNRETEDTEEIEAMSASQSLCLSVTPTDQPAPELSRDSHGTILTLEQAIADTVPDGTGQRNRRVFEFARWLKAMPQYADAEAESLRDILKQWHVRALPHIGTREFDDTWGDFVYGWDRVRSPKGSGVLADLLKKATKAPDPAFASRYESETTRLLIRLCREMQWYAGDGPFFLSCGTAGNLIFQGDRIAAWRRFKVLIADGVLTVEESHTARKATRYRYQGDTF